MRAFHTLDVFTHQPFAGNPLAVVMDSSGLSDAEMQTITREFNLSETVFVLPQTTGGHRADIRIFTPGGELPFAGHPTIGTAVLLASLDGIRANESRSFTLGLKAGAVPCTVTSDTEGRLSARLRAPRLPADLGSIPQAAQMAAALGLPLEALRHDHHRIRRFGAPVSFVYVPLKEPSLLGTMAIDSQRLVDCFAAINDPHPAVFVYAMGGLDGGDVRARMFAPGLGVAEDPATGSASVAFAGIVQAAEPLDGVRRILIEQGYEMGRPSRITVSFTVQGGAIEQVELSGGAIRLQQGMLLYP